MVLAAAWRPAAAQSVPAGRQVAARVCQTCHGMDGLPKVPDAASLAGQNAEYIVRQLQAYAAGERKHEQMSIIAEQLTPDQMADAAAYYGAIEIEVTKLPGG